ncbi:hypothetical protein [Pinibacter soli]|uniref:Right handed beta helix domain-containing protein n=1 Tax=Pinibacter soli TaxID=3044211 RepID=A0ABT6RDN1_9BACT|nr:hypothetical protein [Pinibacter soli]MDI3320679.1 hypothetical protein [Pinibacter soli]
MKYFFLLLTGLSITSISFAKSWRINNNAGVNANYTSIYDAVNSASVTDGDSLYIEPSVTDYVTNSMTISKRLTFIGPGYLLDPANTNAPGNSGLQVLTIDSRLGFFRLNAGANGSKFIGVTLTAAYFNGASNVTFERVGFTGNVYFESGINDAITLRKCFFLNNGISNAASVTITNFVCENNIFYGYCNIAIDQLTGSGNLFRNNSIYSSAYGVVLLNTYIANNIFGTYAACTFTNSTVKNNLFQANQTLSGTATGNIVNVDMNTVYVAGTTGSLDSRVALKAGSPAKGTGLTVGSVVNPDMGAFGATDPYRLSGIPNIPSIYTLTVPTSIPSGSATMNITFSTRNNN